MATGKPTLKKQYAALPITLVDGEMQVLLVTSRGSRRWIIPKGQPEPKLKPHQLAAKEAWEEAGLIGQVRPRSIGSYLSEKRLLDGTAEPCLVRVFVMDVQRQMDEWPEKHERETRWLSPAQAAMKVTEGGLVEILLSLAAPRLG